MRFAWRGGATFACAVCCACSPAVAPPAPKASSASVSVNAPIASVAIAPKHNTLPALDASQFLSALSLERSAKLQPGTLELLAPSYAGSNLGELNARKLLLQRSSDGRILVHQGWPNYDASLLPVTERETRCSFVADCDEPVVQRVEGALRKIHPTPSARDVVEFVAQFISHKHMSRGFDIASVVAQRREGDCTEHAVLTTALMRASGIPSHIVTGVALVQVQDRLLAFGHAWTEYHDGKSWQLADATNVSEPRPAMAYLPLRVMQNEGAGYSRGQLTGFDVVDITTVSVPENLKLSALSR